MLVVRVYGGLGNQIFQYGFYEFLKQNNEEVYLDTSSFRIHKYHNGFELDKLFALDYQIYPGKLFRHWDRNSVVYRAFRKYFKVFLKTKSDFYEYSEPTVQPQKFAEDIYFDGFWQGPRYVQQVPDLLDKLQFRDLQLSNVNQELMDFIHTHTAVAVHIRRGDYLNHPDFSDCCTESYYADAIAYFQREARADGFVFFSDDIEWCKSQYGHLNNTRFVDWNTGESSYLDMYLMAHCTHNIIANSTFSWWGAYLNCNQDKMVILPQNWKKGMSSERYACDGWIRM